MGSEIKSLPIFILPTTNNQNKNFKKERGNYPMKKLINSIKTKVNSAIISARTAIESTSGEGYIDTGVKIIIGVVIGGVILAGLYALFNTTIIPTLTSKITQMFNYAG